MMQLIRSALCLVLASSCFAVPTTQRTKQDHGQCNQTQVVILGAGTAGIAAAQTLSNLSINDFIIVEYNNGIGGRLTNKDFGEKKSGDGQYTVELGANWVQGLRSVDSGEDNPIWRLARKWNISNEESDYSSIKTYNENGEADFSSLFDEFQEATNALEDDATALADKYQDRSVRAGLRRGGWNPAKTDSPAGAVAVEYFSWDFESASNPETSSQVFGASSQAFEINYDNITYHEYSGEDRFVVDQRGFRAWLVGEADTFLTKQDHRLALNTIVTNISYSDAGVIIRNKDGSCIQADYAICTFSLGVLQREVVAFDPELPDWKLDGINSFEFNTFTKIFYQFDEAFWPNETQFFLYADPTTRGYWPVWQSLTPKGFLPGSNIIFSVMTAEQSQRIEAQDDDVTMQEGLDVLRNMFPDADIPQPIAFFYPRWRDTPWSYGSYSNWPPATTLEMHQDLRANVSDRLFFAGEATSAPYFGYLHGAWFEGIDAGQTVAKLILANV
ncbi:amine oxidase [Aaosphaeria arxii CBS 175.79]|uniref:Amine oxidase n=1 Tax=Aaosphaeria arxii CBS 175.79 TaxID=1450172 RepID=A0A6A5Y042_9PLEO|nr:amine oxidase [Aaosphaeria arxii CBS 175.79]KAF2018576.1 amine oxidase [Aaosphaeria arxii CBS 175.79]